MHMSDTSSKKKSPLATQATGTTYKSANRGMSKESRQKKFQGNPLLPADDMEYLKRVGLYDRTALRRVRYWCFKIRHALLSNKSAPVTPEGLKEFIESLPGFAGWEYFAVSWDIIGDNPYMVVLRLQSVWQDWEQVMQRVAIPIDSPPEQIHARIQALSDDYAKKEAKKRR